MENDGTAPTPQENRSERIAESLSPGSSDAAVATLKGSDPNTTNDEAFNPNAAGNHNGMVDYTAGHTAEHPSSIHHSGNERRFPHEPQIDAISDSSAFSNPTAATTAEGVTSSPGDTTASSIKKTTLLVSDWMSDNILVVRYGLMASIGLLTAYGISQSPLLFRYRKVSEIPAEYFIARRTLHCRLVKAETISKRTTLYCRHLSLSERLLSVQWNMSVSSSKLDTSDYLPMQLVGIEAPDTESEISTKQPSNNDSSLLQYLSTDQLQPSEAPSQSFLDELAAKNVPISCKLMARGVTETSNPKKRPIPGFSPIPVDEEQMAFGTIWYRPKGPFQIFASDLGLQLVERGEAIVSTDLYGAHAGMKIVDADSRTNLRKDALYVSKTLADAEQSACRTASGVWKDELYRRQRQDFVDDVEFWERASWPRKLWRRIRGG